MMATVRHASHDYWPTLCRGDHHGDTVSLYPTEDTVTCPRCLTIIRQEPPAGFRLTGQAVVTARAGRYVLTYGESRYSTTTGDGDQLAAEDAARRHGFRLSSWHTVNLGPGCGGETVHTAFLFERDWSGVGL